MRRLPLPNMCAGGLCLCLFVAACGDDPPLAGFNQLPVVRVWATVDTTTTPHRVDIAWRGIDLDGTVVGYLYGFVPQSGTGGCGQHWNPVRASDRRFARYTTRTDTTVWLGDVDAISGAAAGDGFDRYLFVITAVDDAGGVGRKPDCVELSPAPTFEPPSARFALHIGPDSRPFDPSAPPDTVGMFHPFAVSYHARTINGGIALYRWHLASPYRGSFPGHNLWTDDIGDTMRLFHNLPAENTVLAGTFRLVLEAMDEIGMQQREQGDAISSSDTCRLVVNFPPRTRLLGVGNRYRVGLDAWDERPIDFRDSTPDTVALASWIRLTYEGRDDPRDIPVPDRKRGGISYFQVRYQRQSGRIPGSDDASPWLDNYGLIISEPGMPVDSNSFNVGSLEYEFSGRALDEWGTPDPTGVSAALVGNFNPTMDAFTVEGQDGRTMNPANTDTLTWDWWAPANTDTVIDWNGSVIRKKVFRLHLHASGHDDPREAPGAGVKAWRYFVLTDAGTARERFWPLGRAGNLWIDSPEWNVLDEAIEVTFYYDILDMNGDTVFDPLPGYFGRDLTVRLRGRDTHTNWLEPEFDQYVILNRHWELHNSFIAADYGRWTREREVTFHFRMVR